MGRVAVIGLDCAEPELVFDRWRGELPNLSRLMDAGTWGPLRSADPPITVPAWSCMFSGRSRRARPLRLPQPRRPQLRPAGVGHVRPMSSYPAPGTFSAPAARTACWSAYPGPTRRPEVNGTVVTDFLTPDTRADPYTIRPRSRRDRVARRSLPLRRAQLPHRRPRPDPRGALRDDRPALHRLPAPARYAAVGLLHDGRHRPRPDASRVLGYLDADHPRHEPDHRHRDAIRDYYIYLDEAIGELLERSTTRPRCWSSPTTARDRCSVRSASTNGSPRRDIWSSRSSPPSRCRSARRRSTGAGPAPGGRGATTAGCV